MSGEADDPDIIVASTHRLAMRTRHCNAARPISASSVTQVVAAALGDLKVVTDSLEERVDLVAKSVLVVGLARCRNEDGSHLCLQRLAVLPSTNTNPLDNPFVQVPDTNPRHATHLSIPITASTKRGYGLAAGEASTIKSAAQPIRPKWSKSIALIR
jgi:hypothetical protein